ncbi:hypothetical protein [Streptomyces sp. NPDC002078]
MPYGTDSHRSASSPEGLLAVSSVLQARCTGYGKDPANHGT